MTIFSSFLVIIFEICFIFHIIHSSNISAIAILIILIHKSSWIIQDGSISRARDYWLHWFCKSVTCWLGLKSFFSLTLPTPDTWIRWKSKSSKTKKSRVKNFWGASTRIDVKSAGNLRISQLFFETISIKIQVHQLIYQVQSHTRANPPNLLIHFEYNFLPPLRMATIIFQSRHCQSYWCQCQNKRDEQLWWTLEKCVKKPIKSCRLPDIVNHFGANVSRQKILFF